MSLRPQGADSDMLMLGFHRPRNDRPFNAAEKNRLETLATALGCSVRMLCLQDELALRDCAVAQYDQEFPEHGLLFFDERMVLLYGNRTGIGHVALNSKNGKARLDQLSSACRRAALLGEDNDAVATDFSEAEDMVAKVKSRRDLDGRMIYSVHTNRRATEAVFATRCRDYEFSPREVDITRAVAAGCSNGEIAARLYISVRTVENHLRSIYAKAGVNRRTQLLSRLHDFE